MNASQQQVAARVLRWTLALVVLWESYQFGFGPGARHLQRMGLPQWIAPALGGTEIVAAILFLVPKLDRIAGYSLLLNLCSSGSAWVSVAVRDAQSVPTSRQGPLRQALGNAPHTLLLVAAINKEVPRRTVGRTDAVLSDALTDAKEPEKVPAAHPLGPK